MTPIDEFLSRFKDTAPYIEHVKPNRKPLIQTTSQSNGNGTNENAASRYGNLSVIHQLRMFTCKYMHNASWSCEFFMGTFLVLYGYVMLKCLKLITAKLPMISTNNYVMSLLKHKLIRIIILTTKYFIHFLKYLVFFYIK